MFSDRTLHPLIEWNIIGESPQRAFEVTEDNLKMLPNKKACDANHNINAHAKIWSFHEFLNHAVMIRI